MFDKDLLINQIDKLLKLSDSVIEESFRISFSGINFTNEVYSIILTISDLYSKINKEAQYIIIDNESYPLESDEKNVHYFGEPWSFIIAKSQIAALFKAREDEKTILFLSVESFNKWMSNQDPFQFPTDSNIDLSKPITIRVGGLSAPLGNDFLWILPLNYSDIPDSVSTSIILPAVNDVHKLIHVYTTSSLNIRPDIFCITWGECLIHEIKPFFWASAEVLSACLSSEINHIESKVNATLKGIKRISIPLSKIDDDISKELLDKILETIRWVYEERSETRLQLIVDRLSIDANTNESLLSCLNDFVDGALRQAKDNYKFVILDRKDAFHKEMRELMKDMRSQADLYASKTRELSSSICKDIFALLVFIGFSFIGKFDQSHLDIMLSNLYFVVFLKFLAGYFIFTAFFQLSLHWRDSKLSYNESNMWTDILRNYTSQSDKESNFLNPLKSRRKTLHFIMIVVGVLYGVLAYITWNLPSLIDKAIRFFSNFN